jgi:hypothetical protein
MTNIHYDDLGHSVEVLAGVSVSDNVIANPSDSLSSGATVRVANASEVQTTKQVTQNFTTLAGDHYAQVTNRTAR